MLVNNTQHIVQQHIIPFGDYFTWARVTTASLDRTILPPIIILHGGPGLSHDYCLPMIDLCTDGRAVIHYDQIGGGRSTHLGDAPPEFWTVNLFVEELKNLVDYFDLRQGFHILGQSWGGMLSPEYVLRYPEGVLSMTLSNSPASMPLWSQGTAILLSKLPADIQSRVHHHEAAGTTASTEYQAAVEAFYDRHLCRIQPRPEVLRDSFEHLAADPTVYHTMVGPSEFSAVGTLKDWSVVDRLHQISVPSLVLAGEFDEATPTAWEPFASLLQNVETHVFIGASHTPHLETRDEYFAVVSKFLAKHDMQHD
ncbi:proline iminopeptidase-family hydrolase [Agrobacterium sp. NPDC058088]|uniref:proline iminopeptidase-family hydrolase n=1 Tax=Agrobacterium sp. NPDC058088 TaxID=3346335 RepID=UPI0036D9ED53